MKPFEYAENSGTAPSGAIAEVLHAGNERCRPKHFAAIPRDHYLLHLVLSGRGRLRTGGNVYSLKSHECFLIRPYQEHAYQADNSYPWEYLWLGFSGVTDEILQNLYGVPLGAPAFKPASPARLEFHMRRILAALASDNPLEQIYSRALGVLALGCLGERTGVANSGYTQPDYVEEAVSYIETHYASLGNAQSVAEFVGLDRSYFSKVFHERTGISVARFIAETRMTHAKRMLVDTDYKVKAISSLVGYDNYQSFERRFTAIVGMSPSEFRRRPVGERIKVGSGASRGCEHQVSDASLIPPSPQEDEARVGACGEHSDNHKADREPRGEPSAEDATLHASKPAIKGEKTPTSVQPGSVNTSSEDTASPESTWQSPTNPDINTLLRGARGCPSYLTRKRDRT